MQEKLKGGTFYFLLKLGICECIWAYHMVTKIQYFYLHYYKNFTAVILILLLGIQVQVKKSTQMIDESKKSHCKLDFIIAFNLHCQDAVLIQPHLIFSKSNL